MKKANTPLSDSDVASRRKLRRLLFLEILIGVALLIAVVAYINFL